jgi:prepilin signal peptidase PulO-like enzyme (type II secretory pathway)
LPEIPFLVLKIAALIVVGIAAFCDLRTHKIPNKLTFPASGIGIIMQTAYFASWSNQKDLVLQLAAGALTGVLGWFAGVLIMSITKVFLRQMGHGDTKLVAAVGTFLGPWLVLVVYLYYGLCFGIYSSLKMASAVPWGQLWVSSEMKKAGVEPIAVSMEKLTETRKQIIPVAPFIALGTLCCVLFEKQTLQFLGFK